MTQVIDTRLKSLRNISCPSLVQKIINKEVTVQEKDTFELKIEEKVQKYISMKVALMI
jgi:hypothetical protein